MGFRLSTLGLVLVLVIPSTSGAERGHAGWTRAGLLPAPLGQIGRVVEPPPIGGVTGGEEAVLTTLWGCDREQAIFLSRFVSGAALAGEQIQAWLDKPGGAPPRLQVQLFGHQRLLEQALRRARAGGFVRAGACEPLPEREGWKPSVRTSPKRLCEPAAVNASQGGDHWLTLAGQPPSATPVAALVHVRPAPADRQDRCRPRLSAVFFDDQGRARLRYHADFGGELAVELVGDACQLVELRYDPRAEGFRARPARDWACAAAKKP